MIVDTTLGVPQIKAGKVRAMAVSTKTRSAAAAGRADVRRDLRARHRSRPAGPAYSAPPASRPRWSTTLGAALEKFATDPDMNRQLNAGGTQPAWVGPSDMPAHLAADIVRWTQAGQGFRVFSPNRAYGDRPNFNRPCVWRFRSPHRSRGEFKMRTSEPKPHEINELLVSFRFRSSQTRVPDMRMLELDH